MSELTVLVEVILSFYATIGPTTAMLLGILLGLYVFIGIMLIAEFISNFDKYMMKVGFGGMSIIIIAFLPLILLLFVVVFAYRSAESQLFRREMKKYFINMVKSLFGMNKEHPDMNVKEYITTLPFIIYHINQAEKPHPVELQVEVKEEE